MPVSDSFEYLFTCCDKYLRWLEAYLLTNIDASTITDTFCQEWIPQFGILVDVITDRGLQFTSKTFTTSLKTLGTRIHFNTAYHPKSNGLLKHQHCRIKDALTARGGDW